MLNMKLLVKHTVKNKTKKKPLYLNTLSYTLDSIGRGKGVTYTNNNNFNNNKAIIYYITTYYTPVRQFLQVEK